MKAFTNRLTVVQVKINPNKDQWGIYKWQTKPALKLKISYHTLVDNQYALLDLG
jgi:hypothetical protein